MEAQATNRSTQEAETTGLYKSEAMRGWLQNKCKDVCVSVYVCKHVWVCIVHVYICINVHMCNIT